MDVNVIATANDRRIMSVHPPHPVQPFRNTQTMQNGILTDQLKNSTAQFRENAEDLDVDKAAAYLARRRAPAAWMGIYVSPR